MKDRVPVVIVGEFTAEHAKQLQLVLLNIRKRVQRERAEASVGAASSK